MLSQLTLRFHKKLIEALKVRAGRENTSVNALAERFLDDGLKTAATGISFSARPSVPPPSPGMSCASSWFMPGKPSCAGITGWPPSRPWAPCSTSPATCWPGRWSMIARWMAPG